MSCIQLKDVHSHNLGEKETLQGTNRIVYSFGVKVWDMLAQRVQGALWVLKLGYSI